MCELTTATLAATSLGLTAAGTAAQYAGNQKAKKAADAVAHAEKLRQDKFKAEAKALFDSSLGESGADVANKNIGDAVAKRDAATDAAVQEVAPSSVASTGNATSKTVSDETATRTAAGSKVASIYSKNKNPLSATNDVNILDAIRNGRYLQDQGRIANFMSGSAGVVPIELEAAKEKGAGLKALGQGLNTAGSLVGMGAASGMGAAGDAAAKAAAAATIPGTTNIPVLWNAARVYKPDPNLLWGAGGSMSEFIQ
jgi:hypothetical protein